MKNTLIVFRRLLKKNVFVVLSYELILKLATILVFFPVIINAAEYAIKKTGITFVTRGNIMKIVTEPVVLTVIVLSAVEYTVLLLYETGCLAVCFEHTLSNRKVSLRSVFYLGFVKARMIARKFKAGTFAVLFGVSGLLNAHLSVILYMQADAFRMVVEYIFRKEKYIYMFAGLAALTGIAVTAAVMCKAGGTIVDNSTAVRKLKIREFLRSLLLVFSVNVVTAALLFVFYLSALFLAALVIKYTGDGKFAFTRLVKTEGNLFMIIAFTAYYVSVLFNCAMIYSYGAGKSRKSSSTSHILRVPASVVKNGKRNRIAAAFFLTAVLAANVVTAAKFLVNNTILMEDFIISTTVTAHRGGSQFAPENTMDSVRYAIESGADYIEIDVQLSSDGTVIVLHDDNLKRTTGFNGIASGMRYEDIRKLNAGIKFDASFTNSYVPEFEEVLAECKGKINLNVEIKKSSAAGYELADKVIELIDRYDMKNQCVITSVSYPYLRYVKLNSPDLRTGIISNSYIGDPAALEFADFFSVKYTIATRSFVNSAHRAGKDVHVWTVNSRSLMSRMKGMDVDSIITDNPVLCRKVLRRKNDGKSIVELFQTLLKR